jgi:DNA-binding beta-propeller fold protein YncE
MSYTEYLRRKEAAAPKVIDTTLRLDASSYTQRVKFAASRLVNETNLKTVDTLDVFTGSTVVGTTQGITNDPSGAFGLFTFPFDVCVDPAGLNLYVTDRNNQRIRKIVISTGAVSTLAGSGNQGSLDGFGTSAEFAYPAKICIDPAGLNLYLTDTLNYRIRKIVISTGEVSTLAGTTQGFADGAGLTVAQFNDPSGIAIDAAGLNLYVADSANNKIRKIIISTGAVSTVAGTTTGFADGTGLTVAQFNGPTGVTIDSNGLNLYVTDQYNYRIRQVVISSGMVSTVAGIGTSGNTDGAGLTAAQFNFPHDLIIDPANSALYVADSSNHRIRRVDIATRSVSTLAGSISGNLDGIGTSSRFDSPFGIAMDTRNLNLYVADSNNSKIRKISLQSGEVSTTAGVTSGFANTGGIARFNNPFGIAGDSTNTTLYITDNTNYLIRKVILQTGQVSTLAGSTRGSNDGTGNAAQFYNPFGIAIDSTNSNLYLVDGQRVRRVLISNGDVTSLAGNFTTSGSADGTGTSATFNNPSGIVIDSTNTNLYVADTDNHLIRKVVISTGQVTTFAGTGSGGFSDGIGTAAQFYNPRAIVIDRLGQNLYVADNTKIRKIVISTARVTSVTTATAVGLDDGVSTAARFYYPTGLSIDVTGNILYVSDTSNSRIRKVIIPTGYVTTLFGTNLSFNFPQGIIMDPAGSNLYIADKNNQQIKKILISLGYSTIIPINKTKSGGRIADASTYTQYVGGQAVGNEVQAGIPPSRLLLNSNSAESLSGCRTVPEPVPYNPAVAGVYSANMVRRDASQFTRDEKACRELTGEPHNRNELGPSVFVDNTIVGIKNYNLPQNNAKTYIATKCTQCGNNGSQVAKTCSFCIGANHLHPADKPTNVRWGPRPRKSAQPIIVNQSPSDFHKVGAAMRKIPYVEKHHANPQVGHIIYPKTPYRIPRGTAAQLKINDPQRYPGTM